MKAFIMIGFVFIQYSSAQPTPPYKSQQKLSVSDRTRIETKCERFGGESYKKCLEIEKQKLETKKSKDEKK